MKNIENVIRIALKKFRVPKEIYIDTGKKKLSEQVSAKEKRLESSAKVIVRTGSFVDIECVHNATKELVNEVKKINPCVELTVEVDLRKN